MATTSDARKPGVERLLNLAIIACAVLVVVSWAWYFFGRAPMSSRPESISAEQYWPGDPFPRLEGLASSEPAPSLIIFLMSSCSVCRESMPFYRELSSTTRAERPRVIAISFEPEASLRAYLDAHKFRPDVSLSVDPSQFRLRRSPTLLLVGADGNVQKVWVGRLSGSEQREVRELLN